MTDPRKCIGSAKFGIEAHEAPVDDFPAQPSQKDGLGRMCKTHWTEYTRGLARARLAKEEPAEPTIASMGLGITSDEQQRDAMRGLGATGAGDFPRGAGSAAKARAAAVVAAAARDRKARAVAPGEQPTVGDALIAIANAALAAGATKLPETIAEVGSDEGQAALEAAAKAARTARRSKPERKAALNHRPSANSQGDAG